MKRSDSILTSVKQLIGDDPSDTEFDAEIIDHINATLLELNQLGVGPKEGYQIEDRTDEWSDFIEDGILQGYVRIFVKNKVKLVFDPPSSNALIEALNNQIDEMEFRILTELGRDREKEVDGNENNS